MTRVAEIPTHSVSGPQHLLIPDSCPPRHPYAIPTDVSLTLPPLTMNTSDGYYMRISRNDRFSPPPGIPSPPNSDSSRSQSARRDSLQSQDCFPGLAGGQHTPPYSTPESWTPPVSYALTPTPTMSGHTPYDTSLGTFPLRPGGQRQSQQHTYYTPPYGSPAMPAPSSLLAPQMGQAASFPSARAGSAYQSLPPPVVSAAIDYSSSAFAPSMASSSGQGQAFHPMSGSFAWQASPYSQPYVQSQTWVQPAQFYKPSKPTSALGGLPREAWQTIFEYLPYSERLRLQVVNPFWRESLKALNERIKANPSDADFEDMHSLVIEAENYRKHWAESVAAECRLHRGRPRNNSKRNALPAPDPNEEEDKKSKKAAAGSIGMLACYHCFTVRTPEHFCLHTDKDDDNIDENHQDHDNNGDRPERRARSLAPRRYCLDCGIKKGYHKPGVYIERKWGIEIWICCLRYLDHGVMNCPRCGRGCPLTPVTRSSRSSKRSPPVPALSSRAPKQQRMLTSGPLGRGQLLASSGGAPNYSPHYQNMQSLQPWP